MLTEQTVTENQYSVCCCAVLLWHSGFHLIINIIIIISPLQDPLRKSKLTLFRALTLPVFK
jgi:hypothetical protein